MPTGLYALGELVQRAHVAAAAACDRFNRMVQYNAIEVATEAVGLRNCGVGTRTGHGVKGALGGVKVDTAEEDVLPVVGALLPHDVAAAVATAAAGRLHRPALGSASFQLSLQSFSQGKGASAEKRAQRQHSKNNKSSKRRTAAARAAQRQLHRITWQCSSLHRGFAGLTDLELRVESLGVADGALIDCLQNNPHQNGSACCIGGRLQRQVRRPDRELTWLQPESQPSEDEGSV